MGNDSHREKGLIKGSNNYIRRQQKAMFNGSVGAQRAEHSEVRQDSVRLLAVHGLTQRFGLNCRSHNVPMKSKYNSWLMVKKKMRGCRKTSIQ